MAGTTGQSLRLEALRIYIVKPGSDSKDSNKIGTISNNGNNIGYTYDANGNIKSISQNGQTISYTYNELNEVTTEDNQTLNYSMVYSYDAGGNIVSKVQYPYTTGNLGTATNNVSYSYGDGNWKDKLTSYNGKSITYDQIGNPLSYNGNTFGWKSGRQLAYMSLSDGRDVGFKYNDAGIRTEKRVNGVTTKYYLDGDKVISQQDEEGTSIRYNYDANGKLVSMILNGTEYFYIRNAQSDIIGLIDTSGNQVVSYTYDTWGKLISITGSLKDTVGVKNPYRYRGYRYDTETGLYYLNSRYYNPEWGRFINSDGVAGQTGELLSHNMFAYCKNNPVNMSDDSGYRPNYICMEPGDPSYSGISASANSTFNYVESASKASKSSGVDKFTEKISSKVIRERKVYEELGTYTLGKYTSNLSKAARLGKKSLGFVGTVGFTILDIKTDFQQRKYVGAGIDILSSIAGGIAGWGIGLGVAALLSAGAPVLFVGAAGFAVSIGASVVIDKISSSVKYKYYGGK